MEPIIKNLGKVVPTIEGEHNINNKYERLSIAYDSINGGSYISKKDVPVGILITNKEYWQPFSASSSDYATKEYVVETIAAILSSADYATRQYVTETIAAALSSYTEEELEQDFNEIFEIL